MDDLETRREQAQLKIDESKVLEERRKLGQFATPFPLARELVSYGLGLLEDTAISFLEPALGTGVFYSALADEAGKAGIRIKRATGIEIDSAYFRAAKALWGGSELQVRNEDFTHCVPDGKYTLLNCNPPYVRHQYIAQEEKRRLGECVRRETGIGISALSGLYCYFVLLSHKWLAPGAVCGWLIPSEFMDVNYGQALKEYLLNKVHLLRIHRYEPAELQFDGVLVSPCVVWFRNEAMGGRDYEVEFLYRGTHSAPAQSRLVRKSVLQSEGKWTRFPEKGCRCCDGQEAPATIGDYFTMKRGVATGDNNFFILGRDRIQELGLDMTFFRPILPSPRHLKADFVEADADGNPRLNEQYCLLDCRLPEEEVQEKYPALWEYLQSGVPGTSQKYLCRNRRTWYWQEQRQAARFLCSYMGRGRGGSASIRFILNLSEAIAANSYLMLYPKERLQHAMERNPEAVYQIWECLKAIRAEDIEGEGRVYGGGLKKIEPKELAKVPCDGLRTVCSLQ